LGENDIPDAWYNIQAYPGFDPAPILNPETKEPTMLPLPLSALSEQEFNKERWIEVPDPVRDVYKTWRPTPFSQR
jgi:tryptophan synthase beta chain